MRQTIWSYLPPTGARYNVARADSPEEGEDNATTYRQTSRVSDSCSTRLRPTARCSSPRRRASGIDRRHHAGPVGAPAAVRRAATVMVEATTPAAACAPISRLTVALPTICTAVPLRSAAPRGDARDAERRREKGYSTMKTAPTGAAVSSPHVGGAGRSATSSGVIPTARRDRQRLGALLLALLTLTVGGLAPAGPRPAPAGGRPVSYAVSSRPPGSILDRPHARHRSAHA